MGKHGESVEYDGVLWHPRKDGYYQNKHRGLLHRYMYLQEVGVIPAGMHVHHKNHHKFDNRAGNFVLLRPGEHWAEHEEERSTDWHSKGGKAAWAKDRYRSFTCDRCGAEFESRGTTGARYCSAACRDAASRPREARVCCVCGSGFVTMVRSTARTCSRKCTARLTADIKRSRV